MKKIFLFTILLLSIITPSLAQEKEIHFRLRFDEDTCLIDKNVFVYISFENKTMPCHIINGFIKTPNIPVNIETVNFIIKYYECNLSIDIERNWLIPDQSILWVLGFDRKPFGSEIHDSLDENNVKGLLYWQFNPFEKAEPTVIYKEVLEKDINSYSDCFCRKKQSP